MKSAVFLDQDGTIIDDVGYLNDPDQLKLLPGAAEAIRQLKSCGFLAILMTNQSGIARGFLTENKLAEIHIHLQKLLAQYGAALDGIYYCPHHPEIGTHKYKKNCSCRKPRIGMLRMAVKEFSINVETSYVVGDKTSDIGLGQRAGCRTVLVTGKDFDNRVYSPSGNHVADYVTSDLLAAVKWIINDSKESI